MTSDVANERHRAGLLTFGLKRVFCDQMTSGQLTPLACLRTWPAGLLCWDFLAVFLISIQARVASRYQNDNFGNNISILTLKTKTQNSRNSDEIKDTVTLLRSASFKLEPDKSHTRVSAGCFTLL